MQKTDVLKSVNSLGTKVIILTFNVLLSINLSLGIEYILF